jgi:hypothetical protein
MSALDWLAVVAVLFMCVLSVAITVPVAWLIEESLLDDSYTTDDAHPPARAQEWIAVGERLPEVKKGRVEQFWVCAERKHNGKRYVFTHEYANLPDEEGADWMLNGPDGDLMPLVGWCKEGVDSAGDPFYMPDDQDGEIIAWMPMEKPAPPTGSQNTGGAG